MCQYHSIQVGFQARRMDVVPAGLNVARQRRVFVSAQFGEILSNCIQSIQYL